MERSQNRKRSVVISGYYGYRNMGDDAILEMICQDYAADFELTVLSARPEETERRYQVRAINRFQLPQALRVIRGADLLICGGGSLLQDKTSTRSLLYYLSILKMAQLCGVPSVLYAAGIGPLHSPRNRKRVAHALRKVDLVTLRDEESLAFVERLCPGKQALLTADPVFQMEASPDSAAIEILRQNGLEDGSLFAVSLRKASPELWPRLAELLDRTAAAGGCTPVFVCMQDPADFEAAEAVQGLMKAHSHILHGCSTGPDMIAVLRHMRCVLGMRLHALIFGAVAGVPLMGFNTDPKLGALLHALQGSEPIDLERFDPAETAKELSRVLAEGQAPDCAELMERSRRLPVAVRGLLSRR